MLQIWPIPLRALLKYENFLLDKNAAENLDLFFLLKTTTTKHEYSYYEKKGKKDKGKIETSSHKMTFYIFK